MLAAINNFNGEACNNEPFVIERFDLFRAAPFTIQRFAELVTQPNRHYKMKEKFLRGLEKTVLVVSTVEPRSLNNSGGEEDSTEDTMSWMSQTENDSLPADLPNDVAPIPELNLNHVVEAVHPAALANVQSLNANNDNGSESQAEPPDQEVKIRNEAVEESETGISDTPMPVNISASCMEEYNLETDENAYRDSSSALKSLGGSQSRNANPDLVVDAPAAGSIGTTDSSPDLITSAAETSESQETGGGNGKEIAAEVPDIVSDPRPEVSNVAESDVPMEMEAVSDESEKPECATESSSTSPLPATDTLETPAEPPAEERIEPTVVGEEESNSSDAGNEKEDDFSLNAPRPSDPALAVVTPESVEDVGTKSAETDV